MSQDFYEILGVSRDASEDEIQEAYRQKAREYHPDVSDDPNAEEKFKQAKKAKLLPTDEQKRQAYDQMGHDRFEEAGCQQCGRPVRGRVYRHDAGPRRSRPGRGGRGLRADEHAHPR